MNRDTLKRFKLRDQLLKDPLKLFSLIEKSVLAYMLTGLVFIFLEKTGLTEVDLGSSVIGGTIGYLAIAIKLMYHDEAFSELRTHTDINQNILKSAMFAVGYSEKKMVFITQKKECLAFFTSASLNLSLTKPRMKLLPLRDLTTSY